MSAPEKLIDKVMHGDTVSTRDLAVAYVRYETLRKLNPRQFKELWRTNLDTGTSFDDLVDRLANLNTPPL